MLEVFGNSKQKVIIRIQILYQVPLRHSNSRISEIIRQYNESQSEVHRLSFSGQHGRSNQAEINLEPIISKLISKCSQIRIAS